jgi:hypothetical protein
MSALEMCRDELFGLVPNYTLFIPASCFVHESTFEVVCRD